MSIPAVRCHVGLPAETRGYLVSKTVPENHDGLHYVEFLSVLSRKRAVKRYLEIGVNKGNLLSNIHAVRAVGVDPNFIIQSNVSNHKSICTLFQVGSDEFFSEHDCVGAIGGKPDLAFLDGMHTFEFLLRDFYNTEKLSADTTLIGMHDCLPLNAEMTLRNEQSAYSAGRDGRFPGWWTGDVWKIIPILRQYRPDLRIVCVDCPPTGIVFVTNLDPTSTVLKDNYHAIVKEYFAVPNDMAALEKLFQDIEIVRSTDIINDFDHSLFFST
ncbi:class I SAM-dependent methyltransferase [Methylobacterium sp. Gmos1]